MMMEKSSTVLSVGIPLSTTEGRRQRIERILKTLRKNKPGLNAHQILQKTELIKEITLGRFYMYMEELMFSDLIIYSKKTQTYILVTPLKTREREKTKKRE